MSAYARATCAECEQPVMAQDGRAVEHVIRGTNIPCDGSGEEAAGYASVQVEAELPEFPEVGGEFTIEQGIPLPPRNQRKSKYDDVLGALQVGDSFVMAWDRHGPPAGLYQQAERRGVKLTLRRLNKEEIRVWRIQ